MRISYLFNYDTFKYASFVACKEGIFWYMKFYIAYLHGRSEEQ